MLTRRAVLAAGGALTIAAARADAGEEWLTTAGTGDAYAALALDAALGSVADSASPVRLHGIVPSPSGRLAVAVARRPGQVAMVFDPMGGRVLARFQPGAGRVFSGHGQFTPDRRCFVTNELDGAAGVAVVRRPDDGFRIVAEWPTGGDGPHDLMHRADTLVVANGGIEPHTPEARDAEVAGSSIALLDRAGRQRSEGRLPDDLASLSLRHLASAGGDTMVVAAQDLLSDGVARPLLYAIGTDAELTPYDAPDAAWRQLRGYVGSVAYDCSGAFVACASPRGGRIAVWRAGGHYVGAIALADGCGLAATRIAGRFIATSGYGDVVLIDACEDAVAIVAHRTGGPRFDNHMVRLA